MMSKIRSLLFVFSIIISLTSCNNDVLDEFMDWELVSVSDSEYFKVTINNRTINDFPNSSEIYVNAIYKEGDVVLKCVNHPIDYSSLGPSNSYSNPTMGFTITSVDRNTMKIHFDENASGRPQLTDQVTITNSDGINVCNTFLFITRSFGELAPD